MKKTLIALAAVAATGAAFAQSSVTLSGKFAVAYTSSESGAGAKSSGLGVTDGDVVFAAVEDLGGGMKAGASMAVKVRGRDNKVSATSTSTSTSSGGVTTTTTTTTSLTNAGSNVIGGRDASVYLSGGFGTVTLGSIELANGILGLASAGAPVIGQDSGVTLDAAANADILLYSSPAIVPGLTARAAVVDSIGNPGAAGMQAAAAEMDGTLLGVNYSAGALAVAADYTMFGQNAAAATSADTRTRVSGSYDLGSFKLGAGYQAKETFANVKDTQYMVGVSVPMGAYTVGATYAAKDSDDNTKDATGYEFGVQYAFSKRTALQVAYRSLDVKGATPAATDLRVRLMHSF